MSQSFTYVDPKVYDLAGEFLLETMEAHADTLSDRQLEALRGRLAKAMQQAIEQECEAIRQELVK